MNKNRKNPFYQIDYIRIVGHKHNPGVLLHKLHSWFLVMQHKRADGIFYKSNRELTEETGLTSRNIRTAIKFLVENQFIEIKVKGVPPTHWYKINNTKINELLKNQTQVIESRQFVKTTNQFVKTTNPYQHIPNYGSLQELKEHINTSYLYADKSASHSQPSESADMRKKSNPDPYRDLADVLSEKPKPVKRRVSVRQHEARAAYAQARQPDERFSDDVAAKWEQILPNIESIKNHRAGIYTLQAWKQTVVEYQTAHGSANTVLWLQRLVEKGADWIYKIDVDLLHYQPPPRVRYENNVRSLFPNDPTYPTTHFDPNKIY